MTSPRIGLIPADESHREMIFRWRNDPEIVALSRTQAGVGQREHQRWFQEVLADPLGRLYIVMSDGAPVGLIRYDPREEESAEISIYLVETARSAGIGSESLKLANQLAGKELGLRAIVAVVRAENEHARAFFAKAGFSLTDTDSNMATYELVLTTSEGR